MSKRSAASLQDLESDLLQTGHYADLTIQCGDTKWRVHRAIVCPRSAFFEKACNGNFLEGNSGVIDIQEEDPVIFWHLLLYLYTLTYEDGVTIEPVASASGSSKNQGLPNVAPLSAADARTQRVHEKLRISVCVYATGEKFDVAGLRHLAHEQFKHVLTLEPWPHHDFPTIVKQILRSTPASDTGICCTALVLCAEHLLDIFSPPAKEPCDHGDWEHVFSSDTGFLFDVLRMRSQTYLDQTLARNSHDKDMRSTVAALRATMREKEATIKEKEALEQQSKKDIEDRNQKIQGWTKMHTDHILALSAATRHKCTSCSHLTQPLITYVGDKMTLTCKNCKAVVT